MTSKLDRRYSALVEVCGNLFLYFILAIIYVCVDMQSGRTCLMLWLGFVVGGAGPGLWIDGHRGAATCNVDTHGVLLHGVWSVQTVSFQREPQEPTQSIMHLPGASLPGKHGSEAKTNQDPCFARIITWQEGKDSNGNNCKVIDPAVNVIQKLLHFLVLCSDFLLFKKEGQKSASAAGWRGGCRYRRGRIYHTMSHICYIGWGGDFLHSFVVTHNGKSFL